MEKIPGHKRCVFQQYTPYFFHIQTILFQAFFWIATWECFLSICQYLFNTCVSVSKLTLYFCILCTTMLLYFIHFVNMASFGSYLYSPLPWCYSYLIILSCLFRFYYLQLEHAESRIYFFIETYRPELVLGQNSSKFFFHWWYGFFRSQTSLVVQRVTVHKLKKQVKYQLCFVKSLYDDYQLFI